MVGWDWCGFDQKRIRKRYAELVFLHPVGSVSHIVHFGRSGAQSIDALFFILGWDRYGYDKKRVVTHYAVLVVLHPVGSACHIVHSGSSGMPNVDAVFFILGWPHIVSIKSTSGHMTPNLCFCIRWHRRVP
jgi:hypothetical protein